MKVLEQRSEMRTMSRSVRAAGGSVGFVPTMGALHEGHIRLVEAARQRCDHLVVSIFVNPLQFGEAKDLEKYPRTRMADEKLCQEAGVDCIFAPSVSAMYPNGFATTVRVKGVADALEGAFRPGHFDGVTTVVASLFGLISPDVAVFGQKDYQQLKVVQRMTEDLGFSTEVVGHPTVREKDGLALSSRNRRLSLSGRNRALSLSGGLRRAARLFKDGERDAAFLLEAARQEIANETDQVDYVALVHPDTLEPLTGPIGDGVLLVAAHVETVRLIDNLRLSTGWPA